MRGIGIALLAALVCGGCGPDRASQESSDVRSLTHSEGTAKSGGGAAGLGGPIGSSAVLQSSSCEQLLPAAPMAPGVYRSADRGEASSCEIDADATGTVYASTLTVSTDEQFVDVVTPRLVLAEEWTTTPPWLGVQPTGYVALESTQDGVVARAVSMSGVSNGFVIGCQSVEDFGSGVSPQGGLAAWITCSGDASHTGLYWLGQDGELKWFTQASPLGLVRSVGVTTTGSTLVLFADGSTAGSAAQWFGSAGASGPAFAVAYGTNDDSSSVNLVTAGGGALFLQTLRRNGPIGYEATWVGAFGDMQSQMEPVPAWLTNNPDTNLFLIHAQSGYALLPTSGGQGVGCQQTAKIVTFSGQECGSVTFSGADTYCEVGTRIRIGLDGTVMQDWVNDGSVPASCGSSGCGSCSWNIWPGYFH